MNKFGVFVMGAYVQRKLSKFVNCVPVKAAIIKAGNDILVACEKSDAKRKEEICDDSEIKDGIEIMENIVKDMTEHKTKSPSRVTEYTFKEFSKKLNTGINTDTPETSTKPEENK